MATLDTSSPAPTSTAAPSPASATAPTAASVAHTTERAARIGLWALGIGFGGFLLWAALAPLDEGVPGQGMVAIDTKSKTVQHFTGGLVKQVLVREGEYVTVGQLLIRLDEAVARANFESARQRYMGLRAMQDRLQAEQREQVKISFHLDVIVAGKDPQIQQLILTQEQLFQSRRAGLRADLQSTAESIQGQQGLIQAYESMLINRKTQLALLTEELTNTRALVAEGYAPRNRQLELERMQAETQSSLAELQGNIVRARRAVGELQQRAESRQQEYRKDVETQLAEVSREVPGDAEKYRAATDDLGRTEIKSPATGQVVGLAFQTVGGVVGPGQKLMDIVPEDQALLIEARVPPHLIDRVQKDLPVDVRFSSFANSPQLVVDGRVVSISADLLTEPQTNVPYYLARVQVTPDGLKHLGKRQLQAGMPVEVIFKTGERSMLTYLLHPLTKRMAASMTEE